MCPHILHGEESIKAELNQYCEMHFFFLSKMTGYLNCYTFRTKAWGYIQRKCQKSDSISLFWQFQ